MKPFWPRTRQLQPVHLQARDTYVEELLQLRMASLAPASYGVLELTTDDAAWARGTVAFKSLAAIFPSGLMVACRSLTRNGASLPRGASSVFLTVPRTVLRGPNVMANTATEGIMRYRAQGEAKEPWLAPEVRVLFEGEEMEPMETLHLGRVERSGVRVQWETGSIPTVARVRGSSILQSRLKQLIAALEQRKGELLRLRAERPLRLFEIANQDLLELELLIVIQRHLALFVDASRHPTFTPGELYELLVSIHGSLTVFAAEDHAPPPFVHEKPVDSLPWLFSEIRTLLDEAARDRTTVLPFERVDPFTFRLTFAREALVGKRPFLVASGADEPFIRDRVPSLLKMASPAAMPSLLHSALRGVSVAAEFEPAPAIPRRSDVMAYRIDVRDPLWLDIEDRCAIVLHVPQAPPSLNFVLYGIERLV
jgi:type VI secretion system ImpJ/VasE family protein